MKLLIVTQTVNKEDENLGFFHQWIEEFAKRVSHVVVITGFVGSHHLPENVEIYSFEKGLRSASIPGGGDAHQQFWSGNKSWWMKSARRCRRLWRYWELFSYHYARSDAVLFHMIPAFVVAAFPFLLSLRRTSGLWYVHKSVTRSLKYAERIADYIFTASDLSFRLPSKKVIYTGHGIDTSAFAPNPKSQITNHKAIRMLTIGRISPVKDIETVIRACALLKENWDREFTLSVVGGPLMARDEQYVESLKKLVEEKGLLNRVLFCGARPYTEIPSIYHDHDMFLSMSTTGSIDKAVLEAMASGMTVLTANEAFRSLLPPQYFLEKRSPEFVAERIKACADEARPNAMLRELVVKNHGLSRTIKEIVTRLSNLP